MKKNFIAVSLFFSLSLFASEQESTPTGASSALSNKHIKREEKIGTAHTRLLTQLKSSETQPATITKILEKLPNEMILNTLEELEKKHKLLVTTHRDNEKEKFSLQTILGQASMQEEMAKNTLEEQQKQLAKLEEKIATTQRDLREKEITVKNYSLQVTEKNSQLNESAKECEQLATHIIGIKKIIQEQARNASHNAEQKQQLLNALRTPGGIPIEITKEEATEEQQEKWWSLGLLLNYLPSFSRQ